MSTQIPKCKYCYADLRYIPYCIDGIKHPKEDMTIDEFKAKHVIQMQENWFTKLKGFLTTN
jgi:hypothetical protein